MKKKLLLIYSAMVVKNNPKNTTRFNGIVALFLMVMGMGVSWGQSTSKFNDGYITVFKNASISGSTGSAIVLEEYLPSASSASSPNFSVNLPYTAAPGSTGIVAGGTTSSNGAISRSENGRYILVPGWSTDSSISTAAIGVANSANLICAVRPVNGTGAIGTGITGTSNWFTNNNDYRGATSDDGTNYWVTGGTLGVRYTNNGTDLVTLPTGTTSSYTNSRCVNIFNGNLYYSTGSVTPSVGIYQIGSGKPTTASQTATILVAPTPYSFSISPDGLTIYSINGNSIVRYTNNGSAWSIASAGFTLNTATGLVVDWTGYSFSLSGINGAVIYASNTPSSGNSTIVRANDNGTSAMTVTTIASVAVTGNIFKQIAFSPIKQTISKGANTPATGNINNGSLNTVLFQMNLSADEGNSTLKKIVLATSGTAVLGTDISNFRIVDDANNDGVADASEIAAGFTTTGTISGSNITFSGLSLGSYIAQGSSKNFLLIGDVASGATAARTFIPSIASNKTINSIDYTSNLTNAGGSLVTMGTLNNSPVGNTLTIAALSNNWIGGSGTWSTPGNWSSGAIPSNTDNITISSGIPVMDVDYTLPSGKTLILSGTGTLTINPGKKLTIAGTADFGGKAVIIRSDNSGTGAIGQVTGTLTGATNVTIERYIPAKRAWRALTAPLKGSGGSIFSQWQNGGNSALTGVGVELWSSTGGNGMATGPSNSILQYNNSGTGSWTPVTDTNNNYLFTTSVNNAFMVFPTGGYGSGNILSTAPAEATTLKATGQLITGDVTYSNLPSASHTLIGNPYASPLDPAAVLASNASLGGNIWVWDAQISVPSSLGCYNLFTNNTYTNVTGNLASGVQIQSGQAFFVKPITNLASFTIQESHKGSTFSNAVFRTGTLPELFRIGLYKQVNNEWSGRDGAMTVILSDADANQSPNKMANSTENIAFTKNGANFASNHHLPLIATDVLNVKVWNTTVGATYKLKLNTEEFSATNLEATLEDLFTNSRTPLNLDGTAVEYPFTVTTDALSTGDRFRIVFQTSLLGSTLPTASGFSIIPNPVTGDSFQVNLGTLATGTYTYSIYNAIGQEVEKGSINNAAQNTNTTVKFRESAATGIYIMKIKGSDNSVFTAKIIKK